jgi:hypothetical protein
MFRVSTAKITDRGSVRVDAHDEFEAPDLIFYVVPQPAEPGEQQVPRDILFRLPIAVSNTGGRKAVLSSVHLTAFQDDTGHELRLPDIPIPMGAQRYGSVTRYGVGTMLPETVSDFGPWVLDPDDVITLSIHFRRGIDWKPQWTLEDLKRVFDGYKVGISFASIVAVYRKGRTAESRSFVVPIKVEQQDLYLRCLREVTENFTVRPDLPITPFPLE